MLFQLCKTFLGVDPNREPHKHKGIFWIYGDSISKRFSGFLENGPYSEMCDTIFEECKSTYTWIYNLKNEILELKKTDGKDYNHKKVLREITDVSMKYSYIV